MQNTYQTEEIEEHCRSTNQLKRANGLRYLLAGGTRERHLSGTGLSQENCLKTRRIPASQVHAVLAGVFALRRSSYLKDSIAFLISAICTIIGSCIDPIQISLISRNQISEATLEGIAWLKTFYDVSIITLP